LGLGALRFSIVVPSVPLGVTKWIKLYKLKVLTALSVEGVTDINDRPTIEVKEDKAG
jgi:hypothetical protein